MSEGGDDTILNGLNKMKASYAEERKILENALQGGHWTKQRKLWDHPKLWRQKAICSRAKR